MERRSGTIWKWRQRIAYRLLSRTERASWDGGSGEVAPVRLDYPHHDIWLRATSETERKWRARACAKEPWTVRWLEEPSNREAAIALLRANVPGMDAEVARLSCAVLLDARSGFFADVALDDTGARAVMELRGRLGDPPRRLDDVARYIDRRYWSEAVR